MNGKTDMALVWDGVTYRKVVLLDVDVSGPRSPPLFQLLRVEPLHVREQAVGGNCSRCHLRRGVTF